MKKIVIILIVVAVGVAIGFLVWNRSNKANVVPEQNVPINTATPSSTPVAVKPPAVKEESKPQSVLGTSVSGHDITAYHFGKGDTELLFVGGIHGGYSWNTVLVAQELIDYLKEKPETIPQNVKITVIPILNPDGLDKVIGTVWSDGFTQADVSVSQAILTSGRFNANGVDLNRNFDCDWQSTGTWQDKSVSGGSAPFSEPESQAVKNYVATHKPAAVLAWYSAAGGVYASNCGKGILPETRVIMNKYAVASGYPASDNFDSYKITGDMVNWFAKNNIPAISVLLTNHQDVEWVKNLAGIKALLQHYAK